MTLIELYADFRNKDWMGHEVARALLGQTHWFTVNAEFDPKTGEALPQALSACSCESRATRHCVLVSQFATGSGASSSIALPPSSGYPARSTKVRAASRRYYPLAPHASSMPTVLSNSVTAPDAPSGRNSPGNPICKPSADSNPSICPRTVS